MRARTSDALVSPVSNSSAADWLAVESTDPLLPPILLTATDAAIKFLGADILRRDWVATWDNWPTVGTDTPGCLSPSPYHYQTLICLPYAYGVLHDVDTVELGGQVSESYAVQGDAIYISSPVISNDPETPSLMVEYSAGYANANSVPETIKTAIKMIASYLYEHRGACSVEDALRKSGAASILTAYRDPGLMA
jgi:uncharacterized phiE125 gp8 family phage protein